MTDIEKQGTETEVSEKSVKKTEKKTEKSKKPSLKERIAKSLREYKSELKKVVWYSREQTFHSTIVVIVTVLALGVAVAAVDFGFSHLLSWLASLV